MNRNRDMLLRYRYCEFCKRRGIRKRSTEVDHIVPLCKGGSDQNPRNLQVLCTPCHKQKTAKEATWRANYK